MKIDADKKFLKDFKAITDNRIREKIDTVVRQIVSASSLSDIQDLEKIEGTKDYYRIKFDYRYRIGLFYDGDTVILLKVSSREGFYKKFP